MKEMKVIFSNGNPGTMNRIVFVVLLGLAVPFVAYAQKNKSQQCFENVRSYFFKTNALKMPAEGKAYHFRYKITNRMNDEAKTVQVNEIDIKMNDTRTHYTSKDGEFFQDLEAMVLIVHKAKTIMLSNSTFEYYKNKNTAVFAQYQDSLFIVSKITAFSESKNSNNETVQKLTLNLESAKLQYSTIVVYYNVQQKAVTKTEVFYEDSNLLSETVEIQEVDYNYTYTERSPVLQTVVDSQMKVLPRYAGYTIINNFD